METDRVAPLEHLRVRDPCIGHMGMYSIGATEARARPRTPGDGFVVPEIFIAEEEVVHGSLAGGNCPQGPKYGVNNPLRSFHVPCRYRGAFGGS